MLPTFKGLIDLDYSDLEWTVINSFNAAYVSWDSANNTSRSHLETEREFDYDEFPLGQFYKFILETDLEFDTKIKQAIAVGIEVNKNPFLLSGEGINPLSTSPVIESLILPSPYVSRDFMSKKNYLGLSIEHEIYFSDRLSLNFEGTFDAVIGDTTDLPELPSVEPIEKNNFFPELSLNYQLSDRLFVYTTVEYAVEQIEGTDINDRPFNSETYGGIELGLEIELNDNWLATFSFYSEIQNNITTIDPNEPDFDLQIDRQNSNSWTGEIQGEINPGWWIYGFYTYTDATVTEDKAISVGSSVTGVARHSGGLWTSYQIDRGAWRGLGFGSGLSINGDRAGDATNSFTLGSYFQTDAAIFYSQDNFRAAISIQNLFNAGIEDEEVIERSLFGTVWFQF